MPFDIITIEPTTVDGGHAAGDVFFNLTKVELPARACKLVSVFAECAGTAADVSDVKIGILFFTNDFLSLAFTIVASCLGLQPINKTKSHSSMLCIEVLNK